MHAPYGSKKCGGMRVPLRPCGTTAERPPMLERIACDRFLRCRGCPYPRHGMVCWTDAATCLRTEIEAIYARGRRLEAIAG